jgi:hypothetical protein
LTIGLGLVTAAMGVFAIVTASGMVTLGPEEAHDDPRWLGVLCGVIFLLGGAAVVIRGIVGHDDQDRDGLPASTPPWLRGVARLMGLAIVVSFGTVFGWIGFGPGERHFEGSGAVFGELAGRAMFGFMAGLIWLVLGTMAVAQLRRLLARR